MPAGLSGTSHGVVVKERPKLEGFVWQIVSTRVAPPTLHRLEQSPKITRRLPNLSRFERLPKRQEEDAQPFTIWSGSAKDRWDPHAFPKDKDTPARYNLERLRKGQG